MRILPASARPWTRVICAGLTGLFLSLAAVTPALAQSQATQTPTQRQVGPLTLQDALDAGRVREQFMLVLRQYPPSLGRVLKLDPSLMSNEGYLAPYPALVAYLTQHPEIKRTPDFFLERIDVYGGNYYRTPGQQVWNDMYEGLSVVIIMSIILGSLGWIVRTIIDSRRWHRLSKTQTEVHNKLLDRFTANDELIAYVQSPAGKKFLEAAPINIDGGARALSAPFGRILWSVQAGMVAAAAGVGLIFASGRVDLEAQQPLFTMGVFALSIGVGFVASAVVSYALSRRLGLFEAVSTFRREQTGL